jgi:hypothetical protein
LHRKFNEADSLEQIRNRYRSFKQLLGRQVEALQKSPFFLTLARQFYADGYKDWHILAAVFNLRLNLEMRRLGLDIMDGMQNRDTVKMVSEIVEHSVEPAERIIEAQAEMVRMFFVSDATCLRTYGFELRRPDVRPEVLQRFLRERMRHYDLDVEHSNLFGDPLGEWPRIQAE